MSLRANINKHLRRSFAAKKEREHVQTISSRLAWKTGAHPARIKKEEKKPLMLFVVVKRRKRNEENRKRELQEQQAT